MSIKGPRELPPEYLDPPEPVSRCCGSGVFTATDPEEISCLVVHVCEECGELCDIEEPREPDPGDEEYEQARMRGWED